MFDAKLRAIAELQDLLRQQEAEVASTKVTINSLSKMAGLPEPYPNVSLEGERRSGPVRSDQFYGMPLTTALTEILAMRKAAGLGAATVAELYEALVEGGFAFQTKNPETAKRGLYAPLSKNPKFHRLPNGRYGLRAWYPGVRPAKPGGELEDAEEGEAENG